MDFFAIPQHAIDTFDQLHQLRVTVHDLTGKLWPFLSPDRFRHDIPQCLAVKNTMAGSKCLAFEGVALQEELARHGCGRVHICHAGFVEWVVPVLSDEALEMVLFAGIRLPSKSLNVTVRPTRLPIMGQVDVPSVSESDSVMIFEHLYQLAARLHRWLIDLQSLDLGKQSSASSTHRRVLIQAFILHRHTHAVYLADLAKSLGLTESRTSHVVQEMFGQSFRELLLQARLRTAMGLLRHSDMDMSLVASKSGFDDLRHFYRVFKRQMHQTPRHYRLMRD